METREAGEINTEVPCKNCISFAMCISKFDLKYPRISTLDRLYECKILEIYGRTTSLTSYNENVLYKVERFFVTYKDEI